MISSLFEPLMTAQGWVDLVILIFLEMALGIDNLVFIAITSARLPKEKRHIGRRLGLVAAMLMRCILLCCITALLSFDKTLVTLPFGVDAGTTPISIRSLIFLLGGIYLVYKGIVELKEAIYVDSSDGNGPGGSSKRIGLARAIALIMVMDIVFSLDSVITAAGLSGMILIMCIAVILAVLVMIIFADPISDFINNNREVKVVALLFVMLVGVMLLFEGFDITAIAGIPLNALLYSMMAFGLIVALLLMWQRVVADKRAAAQEEEGAED